MASVYALPVGGSLTGREPIVEFSFGTCNELFNLEKYEHRSRRAPRYHLPPERESRAAKEGYAREEPFLVVELTEQESRDFGSAPFRYFLMPVSLGEAQRLIEEQGRPTGPGRDVGEGDPAPYLT